MRYGLSEQTITTVNHVFAMYPEVESVILYGSRAMGSYKNGSDIDLTVKGEKLNLSLLCAITNELDELLLPYTFDVSIFKQIDNKDLIEHIERVGITFYQKRM